MGNTLPTSEFTTSELKTGIFIARHKELIKKIALGFFIVADVAMILGAAVSLAFYILGSKQQREIMSQLTRPLIDWPTLRPLIMSRPLVITQVESVSFGGKTDFLAKIKNANNNRWSGQVSYRFIWAGGATSWYQSFILPGEEKSFLAFGAAVTHPENIAMEINNVSWQVVNSQDRDRLNNLQNSILVSDIKVQNPNDFFAEADVSAVTFKVQNNSPFTYHDVSFRVIVQNGLIIRAINYLTIPDLPPAVIRDAEVRWVGNNIFGGQAIVEPDFNYLAEGSIGN